VSNGWIEPPPPQQGMGCFAKGCLILIVFLIFLGVAVIGGTIYGVHYLRHNYFPAKNIELPASASTEQEQQLAREKWYSFARMARAHAPARIEMTADELNALIASEPKLRGKAYVSINDNVGHLRVSIPLDEVNWLKGHYINGECTVQSAVSGSPADARITSIVINGHAVSDDALNVQYPPWSVRRYLSGWTERNNLKTFEIHDGKVILETKGSDD
jgi:hypothetical protein